MKQKKAMSRKLLLIVSFLVAIVLWFVVSVFINPTGTRRFGNVQVSLSSAAASLETMGLSIVGASTDSVSIEVSGSRLEISALTADDFTVTPVFSGVSGAGIYTLDLTVVVNSGIDIEVLSISPETVDITVARIDTVALPLTHRMIGDVPEGYFLESVTLGDETVTVTGPSDVVSRIASAAVLIEEPVNGVSDLPVLLLDENGEAVEDEAVTQSITSTAVTVNLLKTKTVTVSPRLSGAPAGTLDAVVTLSADPGTVTVAGPEEAIDALPDVYEIDVDISTVSVSETREIELALPANVRTVDGISSVEITVDVSDRIIIKYVDVRDFVLSPYLSAYNVTVETVRLRNVEIAGLAEVVDAITAEDIVATVVYDETDVPQKGRYTMQVRISSNTLTGFWVVGDYEVNVKVD